MREDSFEWKGTELLVCACLQLILVFIAYRLDCSRTPNMVSESAWAILFGLVFGCVLAIVSPVEAGRAGLSPDMFFWGLLPPIILEAGFNMKKRVRKKRRLYRGNIDKLCRAFLLILVRS